MKKITFLAVAIAATFFGLNGLNLNAQNMNGSDPMAALDTTGIYGERQDSLDAAVFVQRQDGTYLSRGKEIRTEVISAAGLCKMACCNLAESFENSASVTVGYSDAVTGARQIRLLGLSGTYTQMLDENRPVMRGLAAPFGLTYVPGQWLESIQIAKGATSVINGVESMTGQINLEHRKPTDEKPLFINAAVMADSKMDLNIASSLQMGHKWSTIILGHVSGNIVSSDHNKDGFIDEPMALQFNLSNRWLYSADNGVQVRFGIRALQDTRKGGQSKEGNKRLPGYDHNIYDLYATEGPESIWGSYLRNRSLNGYLKIGIPLNEEKTQDIAMVADYNWYGMNSYFGKTSYLANQGSAFFNLLYQNQSWEKHHLTVGASATYDRFNEDLVRKVKTFAWQNGGQITNLVNAGVFGEYTFKLEDKFSVIAGLRGDWYNNAGFKVSPRVTIKYSPIHDIVIRANGGRGLRQASPIADNIGVLSTGKAWRSSGELVKEGDSPVFLRHDLEDAWTFGGNITYYLPFGESANTYLSVDYFRTQFAQQTIVDYEHFDDVVDFYLLNGKRSFTDNIQLDFSVEPIERFTITTTFRYTNAKIELADKGLVEKPMTSRYKGVLNLQYATKLNKWIFDFTASVNGPCRVYGFMEGAPQIKQGKNGYYSPAYPLLYLQITKRFKGVDIYIGGENLTNFHQKQAVFGAANADGKIMPSSSSFDASSIWGPIMGAKFYAGLRFTLWKK